MSKTTRLSREERYAILVRDNFRCVVCGIGGKDSDIILEVHHILPRSCGGSNDPSNLQVLCVEDHDYIHYSKWTGRPRTFTELKDNQGKRW